MHPADGTSAEIEPFQMFGSWLEEATADELNDPNAMALATTDANGLPNVRMVLLKEHGPEGFVFFTNTQSQKGMELAANAQAAGVLHWKSLRRQVRFRGQVEPVSDSAADAYFASRARESRIGAWASRQSQPLGDRALLEAAVARETERFRDEEIPRPPHWSGYRIKPVRIEFWSDRPYRLHDRLIFSRDKPEGDWDTGRLYP